MQNEFLGYHSEWNMGSPGGWDYQRMAQEIGKLAWQRIKEKSKIKIELDFDAPILNPVPNFAQLLIRAHTQKNKDPNLVIALVAEKETIEKVGENIRFVEFLNGLNNVKAILTDPASLELKNNNQIFIKDNKISVIFLDFNNNVICRLRKKHNLSALLTAIKQGMVINPRGMEPIGAKGIFEAVTSEHKELLSPSTVKRTPWTRQFYPRRTEDPQGKAIPDLVQWVKNNWQDIILKPVHGYSGKGIIIGHKETDKESAIKRALEARDYIVQPLIPLELWAEEFPWLDKENKTLFLKRWQTDFRCFITDIGLIGFVTRFGGIPTNVGSGGGVQSTAILRSALGLKDAIQTINRSILNLGFDFINHLQKEINEISIQMGNVYLLGPIMGTLRPRVITERHITQLKQYAKN